VCDCCIRRCIIVAGTLTLGSNSRNVSIELERCPYLQATSAIIEMKDTKRDPGEGGDGIQGSVT